MRYCNMAVFMLVSWVAVSAYAEEKDPPKGVEMISDTVTAAANKTSALLCGKLEFTMSQDRDKYKDKDNYTINAIGQKVPTATRAKSWKKL